MLVFPLSRTHRRPQSATNPVTWIVTSKAETAQAVAASNKVRLVDLLFLNRKTLQDPDAIIPPGANVCLPQYHAFDVANEFRSVEPIVKTVREIRVLTVNDAKAPASVSSSGFWYRCQTGGLASPGHG